MKEIWQAFKSSVKGFDSPSQLALGVAFGLVIGLLPKDSLLPYMIGVVALLTNANLLSLIISGVVFSSAGTLFDPLSHQIGLWVLTFDPFEACLAWLHQLPIVPWTRFENTVVMGSLVLGLALCLPVYSINKHFFAKYGDAFFNLIFNNRFSSWLIGAPSTNLQES